jgi:hypothetical protein
MAFRKLRYSSRPDRDHFGRMVAALPPPAQLLGLTHVTTGYILRDILDAGTISSNEPCKLLKEPVVYAFYGRASFRNADDAIPTDLSFLFPVVFVLDPAEVPAPKYHFGFDTGAFMSGYIDDYLDPRMPLFDFYLEPDISMAARLVEFFFGDASNFLENSPKMDASVPADNYELVSYQKMLIAGGRGSNKLDDRVSTPELIFDKPISLKRAVKAIILPDPLSDAPEIGGRISKLGIRNEGYEWSGVSRPSEYHMLIRRRVKLIYRDLKWL